MGIVSLLLNQFGFPVLTNILISAGVYLGALYLFKESVLEEIIILFKNSKKRRCLNLSSG